MADRQALHAYLSEEAHAAWQQMAEENGVSVTGILEALGKELRQEIRDNGNDAEGVRRDLIKRARRIDAERRRRGGSGKW